MAPARQDWLDYLIYLVIRLVLCIIQAMPTNLAWGFAEWLAWLAYRVNKRHRLVATENIRHAFPELATHPQQIDRLVRGCYRHFCLMIVELALLPRKMRLETWRKLGTLVNAKPILEQLLGPRPVLIVTAHFGNWELAGFALGALGFRTYAIARVLDNPYLERFLKTFRERTGQTIIAKKDDFDRLTEVMAGGGKVATLADQDAGKRGVFVNFFHRPASAHKAVALMAIEFDAPMLVVGVPRVREPFQYEIICEEVIDPRDYATRSDAIPAITQQYHAALERLIRRYPEQYFWLHRRWKTEPPVRGKKPSSS